MTANTAPSNPENAINTPSDDESFDRSPRDKAPLPQRLVVVFARLALSAGFASAVADRLGCWGPPGSPNVAWGNIENYNAYVALLNPWLPETLFDGMALNALGWFATLVESVLAVALLIGWPLRWTALIAGGLLTWFGLAMTFNTGLKSPLDYSVFSAAGAAWLLYVLAEEKQHRNTHASK